MTVAPGDGDRIVPNGGEAPDLCVSSAAISNRTRVALAPSARTESAQDVVGIHRAVSVGPIDVHDGGPLGSFDRDRAQRLWRGGQHEGGILIVLLRFARAIGGELARVGHTRLDAVGDTLPSEAGQDVEKMVAIPRCMLA